MMRILILLLLCGAAHADTFGGLPTRDGKILIEKKEMLELRQFIRHQNAELAAANEDAATWAERYYEAEVCVREAVKRGDAVVPCFVTCTRSLSSGITTCVSDTEF